MQMVLAAETATEIVVDTNLHTAEMVEIHFIPIEERLEIALPTEMDDEIRITIPPDVTVVLEITQVTVQVDEITRIHLLVHRTLAPETVALQEAIRQVEVTLPQAAAVVWVAVAAVEAVVVAVDADNSTKNVIY